MTERLRPPPTVREAGSELVVDLVATARALRQEAHPAVNGHRQISVLHRGPVRVIVFAFDAGGRLAEHRAPGWVTIHALSGRLGVQTADSRHDIHAGGMVVLDPDVPHSVEAVEASDMLLTVHLTRA